MKKTAFILKLYLIITAMAVMFSSCSASDEKDFSISPLQAFVSADGVGKAVQISEETRGVWIASVYNINFPSSPDLPANKIKAELDAITDTVLNCNLNTVYFQVHPESDALYRSDIFPVSRYLYSDGILHFDPLKYMSEICREKGISLFAWVNPLRLSVTAADSAEDAIASLPKGSPGKDKDLSVFYGDGKLYLNCGVPAVRDLVSKAVGEIVSSYDIDGVVFDDYFYPYPVNDENGVPYEFDDSDSFEKSGSSLSLADWRRDNVNQMIKQCYDEIKRHDPDILFGVSPFGIWQNDDGTNGGSATAGLEAYSALYCDATAWIKGKYIDFISPQLYWKCDNASAPYGELISFWNRITEGTGVDLIVSHGIYQYETWENPQGEIIDQVNLSRECLSYKGSMLYGYEALADNISGIADDSAIAFSDDVYYYHSADYTHGIELSVEDGAVINGSRVVFEGYSNPEDTLTVNGTSVSRSHGGYFKCELELSEGENNFVFTCGDNSKTITVIRNIL